MVQRRIKIYPGLTLWPIGGAHVNTIVLRAPGSNPPW